MRLSRLQLYDFRNYKQLQLELDPGVNLILGENAQGKTNLLEAVSYLSTGRSFRTAKTQELIRFGADFADLNADVFSQGQTRTAAISLKLAERELLRRDTGEEPVLLLDDVLSELDAARQDFVLNQITSGQVFITCCEVGRVTEIGKTFEIRAGGLVCT